LWVFRSLGFFLSRENPKVVFAAARAKHPMEKILWTRVKVLPPETPDRAVVQALKTLEYVSFSLSLSLSLFLSYSLFFARAACQELRTSFESQVKALKEKEETKKSS
jgi:hypothetical protein